MTSAMQTVTLITGASSGIGKELARQAAAAGKNLILTARREDLLSNLKDELEKKHGIKAYTVAIDLSRPSAPEELIYSVHHLGCKVAELINSAGFGRLARFIPEDEPVYRDMLNLNIVVTTRLCALVLPDMAELHGGRIMNIASTAAFQPIPGFAVYSATKSYILSFSQALYSELKPAGISVTVLCPGITESEFHKVAGTEKTLGYRLSLMSAASVARSGYKAMQQGKRIVVPGFTNYAGAMLIRFVPTILASSLAKKILSA